MRDTFSRLMTSAMVAGAALLVSACGESSTPADANSVVNAEEPSLEGSVNDVTAVDAAGASDNVVLDNADTPVDNTADTSNAN